MKQKALVVLSGGQDSTTCLFWAKERYDVHCITFNYGQKHKVELDAAADVAALAGVQPEHHEFVIVDNILKGSSPLVNPDFQLEQYADHNSLPGGLEKTFVPMRNQLFLTIAANRAHALGCNTLVTGVCQEDSGGYPDCTQEFINALMHACTVGTFTGTGLKILTPLMYLTKAQSVQLALGLPGCYRALAHSHTSYDGEYPPLGHDHATLLRAKGFIEANVPDPLILRAVREGLMEFPSTPNYAVELVAKYMPWIL